MKYGTPIPSQLPLVEAHRFFLASFSPRQIVAALLLLLSTGCATVPGDTNVDPFEGPNRAVFVFNDGLDSLILGPVARAYKAVTPGIVQRGIRNAFANLWDINGVVNAGLQGRPREMAQNGSRFIINSTLGLLGLVDVASEMGIAPYRTDFGHTLASWGFESGPYIMVPFFGPRTLRSGTGSVFDAVASLQWQLDNTTRNALFALEIIDSRAALVEVESLITGDRYVFIRDIYLQQRENFVNGGVIEDSFSDYDAEFEWDE